MAGPAAASSIEVITSASPTAPAPAKPGPAYRVPALPKGQVSATELREVGGQTKIYRTEAFLGGSPVVFVTKATPAALAALKPASPDVDKEATAAIDGPAALDLSAVALKP